MLQLQKLKLKMKKNWYKKALNVIVFNVPEDSSNSTNNSLHDSKKDLQITHEILGNSRIEKKT